LHYAKGVFECEVKHGKVKVGTKGTNEQSFKIKDLRGTLGRTMLSEAEQSYGVATIPPVPY